MNAEFQKKCLDVFRQLKKEGKTIVLVTHDMSNVERFCDRALVLNEGKVVALTSPHEASSIYARLNIETSIHPNLKDAQSKGAVPESKNRWGDGGITVKKGFF